MSNFMEIIKNRRSIRNYEDKDVPNEMINTILEAVQWSPSWGNTQCWEIIIVKDTEKKKKLQEIIGAKNPATKAITGAPVVIALTGKLKSSGYYKGEALTKFGEWCMFDLGIAAQSICLAAHSLGLGTVIVGVFDHDKAREILSVPEGYEVMTLIPLGFPAKISSAPKRREIKEFAHYDKF